MDDLEKYISKRKARNEDFAKDFDSGFEELKIGVVLRQAREQAGITQEPAWHSDVLAERERNILIGEALFEEWNTAKKKIRGSLP